MAAQRRDESRYEQGGSRGPWQGGQREGQRDEDDFPQPGMRGGSVYEERQGYGPPRPGYSAPEGGAYEGYVDPQSTGRRDYGGGPHGGYPGRGFGSGGYGQGGEELGPAGGPPRYAGAGYGAGEPTYMGYGYQEEQHRGPSQRQDYGPGQGQQAYVSYGGSRRYRPEQHQYGEGPEPSSGAFGGAGLGAYSEGSSDIGRGIASAFGYGEQAAYRQAGYGRQGAMAQPGGGFRGRGPKGYQRSDERINDEVCQYLCDDDYIDASDVEVTVSAGEVTLTGTVPDRQSRRRAEDLAEQISGVQHVQNNLRVNRPR
ncbi:MAG TPA: BON domain-containing protein [Lacipirellula sp.]